MRHDGEELLDELDLRLVVAEVNLSRLVDGGQHSRRRPAHKTPRDLCHVRAQEEQERTWPCVSVPTCSCACLVTPGWQWPRLVTPTAAPHSASAEPFVSSRGSTGREKRTAAGKVEDGASALGLDVRALALSHDHLGEASHTANCANGPQCRRERGQREVLMPKGSGCFAVARARDRRHLGGGRGRDMRPELRRTARQQA